MLNLLRLTKNRVPTYFNIDDLTQYTPEKAEGTLRDTIIIVRNTINT